MRVRRISALLGCAPLLVLTLASAASAQRPDDPGANGAATAAAVRVCAAPPEGFASCHAIRNDAVDENGRSGNGKPGSSTISGYGPADIQSAYNVAGLTSGATVAIVDAYDDVTAASDLNVYRNHFNLPAVNSGGPTFRKVNQSGGSTPPVANASWGQEISLDLDMVSATCPTCNILLVEANSASFANLGAAVNWAKQQPGVIAVSNSYGGSDSTSSSNYDAPSGVAITASTGDNGYGVESPASFASVVAVGGTSLKKSGGSWSESAWSGAGSGCSTLNGRPNWQTSATQCNGKANADVSAVADPNTGVAVYDSTSYQGRVGWLKFGGTSASSPIVASMYALANNFGVSAAAYTWAHTGSLNDVTAGSNGTCTTTVWCHAGTGWDGPTGLGTPNGVGAF